MKSFTKRSGTSFTLRAHRRRGWRGHRRVRLHRVQLAGQSAAVQHQNAVLDFQQSHLFSRQRLGDVVALMTPGIFANSCATLDRASSFAWRRPTKIRLGDSLSQHRERIDTLYSTGNQFSDMKMKFRASGDKTICFIFLCQPV
jgi:hypothetical protein